VSDAVLRAFAAYDWPGNVRELENACERIAETAHCGRVGIGCVAASVLFHRPAEAAEPAADELAPSVPPAVEAPPAAPAPTPWHTSGFSLDDHLRQAEARLIASALDESRGNKSRAARLLGIKRSTLGDRIARCAAQGMCAPEG
jgi:DNA-binding NtrC family response regulator